VDQRVLWDEVFTHHYRGDPVARRIFLGCGVSSRHAVVDPLVEDASGWTTGERMRRYTAAARPLGVGAVAAALADARLPAADVGLLVVASCTGYTTPGLDVAVAEELGMPATLRRLVLGHMGCYAALPALAAAADFVRGQGRPAVVLCLELPSLHVQPAAGNGPRDLEQVVAHALFGDAAAAVVLEPDAATGLELLDTAALTDPSSAELMRWDVTDHGFRMVLSPKVPDVLARYVGGATEALLARHGLVCGLVEGWAVHPGGPRIVAVVAERLGLAADQIAAAREVLDTAGNCSSATVLLVLDRIRNHGRRLAPGDPVVAMAFGPGLTLWSALLRARAA
jgi:predicted naringenin-chalcone synthase